MDRIVFFGGIFAGKLENDFGTAGVFGEEVGDLRSVNIGSHGIRRGLAGNIHRTPFRTESPSSFLARNGLRLSRLSVQQTVEQRAHTPSAASNTLLMLTDNHRRSDREALNKRGQGRKEVRRRDLSRFGVNQAEEDRGKDRHFAGNRQMGDTVKGRSIAEWRQLD